MKVPMGRQKAFDPEQALDAAMYCFWTRGYVGTSMRDLTDRMGIAGPSLYNAFGNKEALFEQALDRYCRRFTHAFLQKIEEEFPAGDRIAELFAEVVERSVTDADRRGCFLINSALDIAPHDARLCEVITDHLNRVRSFFERNLCAMPAAQRSDSGVAAVQAAEQLLAVLLGIRVLARMTPSRVRFDDAVLAALAPLGLAASWDRRRRSSYSNRKRSLQAS